MVIRVVSGSHLQGAGSELAFHVFIEDHRYGTLHQGHDHVAAHQVRIARIIRMHRHGRISGDGLGARGGDGDPLIIIFIKSGGDGLHFVAHIDQLRVDLLVHHLLVAHGGQGHGVPVHHAVVAVHQAFLVEVDEDIDHGLAQRGFHGEACAVPVAAGAELLQLFEDGSAVLLLPCEGMLKEFFTADRALLDPLFRQQLHHLGFRGDASVIRSRHPAGVLALHPRAAHQHVLDGVVEHVPHVQHARYVRRWDHHSIGLAFVRHGTEIAVVQPVLVPLAFDLLGLVAFRKFHLFHQGCEGNPEVLE